MKHYLLIMIFACAVSIGHTQEQGVFSGSLESNFNYFQRDTVIGAANIPQYDKQLTGGELWLNLNYSIQGFDIGVRFDMFTNSNLLNPTGSYTDQGIGRWFIKRTIDNFEFEAGYLYDQIGSGIIYQAYEIRPQLIDNALYGGSIKYDISDNWMVKGFMGRQKFLFDVNPGNLKGIYLEGFKSFGNEEGLINFAPGIGFVNRTHNDATINSLVNVIKNYEKEQQSVPTYNTYLTSIYNTLTYKSLTWYVEGAYKSPEVFFDPEEERIRPGSPSTTGRYVKESGSVLYSSIGLGLGKLGLTIETKRTENFDFRSDPTLRLNRGLVNFIPPMNRLNTYRLTARYSPATQLLSEQAIQLDARYKFNKTWSTVLNYSNIQTLDGDKLYDEQYIEVQYKRGRKLTITGGLQLQNYNQEVYELKPTVPNVKTITPFVDILYKIDRKKSIRLESQFMSTDQDFGSWAFALVEVGLAPHWLFELSGMYNVSPNPKKSEIPTQEDGSKKKILYPTFGVVYNKKSNRISLRYVKQVEGVVCNGGVCRLEPAFSGVRLGVTSNF